MVDAANLSGQETGRARPVCTKCEVEAGEGTVSTLKSPFRSDEMPDIAADRGFPRKVPFHFVTV